MIRHALAELLQRGDIHDPVLTSCVVSVPEVRMTPDLKLATAYVMPIGGGNVAGVVGALNANKKYIRREVARAVHLKYAPDLRFLEDESFDEAMRIDAILSSPTVRRDIEND